MGNKFECIRFEEKWVFKGFKVVKVSPEILTPQNQK